MNNRAVFLSSLFLKIMFVGSLFIVIFISSITYKHTIAVTDSTQSLMHSYKVHIELERLISYIKDAETGQRGFMLSHDSIFLQPFNEAFPQINNSFDTLKILTADNLRQQINLDTLYQLINLRFSYFNKSLAINSTMPFNAIKFNENLLKGKNVMDNIRTQISSMIDLEMGYLKEQQKKYESEISFTPLFTLLLLFFSLLIFLFSYLKINKDFEILKKSNDALLITTESIKHAEVIGNFSTWQWDLQANKLIYSDNQYRLLGCEPQSFEPTVEKFLEFVHPDDRHIITEGGEQVMNEKNPPAAFFRIVRQDGSLRFIKSIGRLLTNVEGEKILIGINSDVTEQHLSSIVLEEKNRALEYTNKELASFNHIASHDLQEPLRKIQTYISRISEKDRNVLSDIGKNYFERIETAATRMRALIDDLLLFSNTNKAAKIFELTDLNFLLDNTKQELVETIEEKNAIVQSAPLPTIHVIPFQIQQLFINLVGNALKYTKKDVPPFIKIECETIMAKDYPILKMDTDKNYYKMSVSDNGLGFEQQYAESIFNLFQRLHHTIEYPGIGLGLAICKKIIENHEGFIVAEGVPNKGATFTIFLPL